MREKAPKKSLEKLMSDYKEHKKWMHKSYIHKKSGQCYQLLMLAHDVDTQELMAVYCLNANSQMKFIRPMSIFMENFEEGYSGHTLS